ncbi:MAG TPA: hypothetical protein DCY88_01895 [Cyanobacteria bacterium UBA11372]|nr:hypothetical protein [Cyanobacteria bacterium UBA11372]
MDDRLYPEARLCVAVIQGNSMAAPDLKQILSNIDEKNAIAQILHQLPRADGADVQMCRGE